MEFMPSLRYKAVFRPVRNISQIMPDGVQDMLNAVHINTEGVAGILTHLKDYRSARSGKKVGFPVANCGNAHRLELFGESNERENFRHHKKPKPAEAQLKEGDHFFFRKKERSKKACPVSTKLHPNELAFDTRWKPDERGRMSLFMSRRPGFAHVSKHPEDWDMAKTYHRERARPMAWKPDQIWNDIFLTGTSQSNTSDVLNVARNRSPPSANPDGPFERTQNRGMESHLDRTLAPRADVPRQKEGFELTTSTLKNFRERTHIFPLRGQLVGDNKRLSEKSGQAAALVPGARRVSIAAPWSQSSFE